MEIKIPHPQLTQALELVSKVSTKHVTLPVLQCIRLAAGTDGVVIQATNLEVHVEIPLPGVVVEAGEAAVPASIFLQSVQHIKESEVTLRVDEGVLQIDTKQSSTSIKLQSVADFPSLHKLVGEESAVQAETFALGIRHVVFAASHTSIKPELGSVFITQKKEHSLTFVATDSFRLTEKTVPQKNITFDQSIMVPQQNASELARVCEVRGGEVQLLVSENQCALQFADGTYISSRLVTGSFPDYVQIIPKEFVSHVTVLKADLQQAFKKTGIFLNKFRQVTLIIADGELTVSAQNSEVGHTTSTMKAEVDGEELRLNFNQQYVMDPLQYIHDDAVVMSFAGVGRAMVMRGVSDTSLRYLVMPMNK